MLTKIQPSIKSMNTFLSWISNRTHPLNHQLVRYKITVDITRCLDIRHILEDILYQSSLQS